MSAFEVAELAKALNLGYASYLTALEIARHPNSSAVVRAMVAEDPDPIDFKEVTDAPAERPASNFYTPWYRPIRSKDPDAPVYFDFIRYWRRTQEGDDFARDYERAWLVGALLTLDDRLKGAGYFDKSPVLELVRHLRNGVAHGNRFDLRGDEPKRPAHLWERFRVTKALNGAPVLFDFMEPGDVFQVFVAVSQHLFRMAESDGSVS